MSSPERSPKRQRTSYSPASPPLQQEQKAFVAQSLHTPPPSVHMSPSWQSQNLPTGAMTDTPPHTSNGPSQAMSKTSEAGDSAVQTPQGLNTQGESQDVEMVDAEHRRTDHERLAGDAREVPAAPSLYKFSANPVNLLQPDPSRDLLEQYSLQAVQASVARRDAKTGEKINKLRKSYETKSRNLGIEGRNKATVQEGHLQGLVDPLWDAPISEGVTMWDERNENTKFSVSNTNDIMDRLQSALKFKVGNLPKAEHNEWTQQLGLDEVAAPRPPANALQTSKSTNNVLLAKTAPLATVRASAPTSPASARPDRAGKKRRYDESSYEGYDDDGYSTGGMDDRRNGAKRMKRKDTLSATSPTFQTHAGSSHSAIGLKSS